MLQEGDWKLIRVVRQRNGRSEKRTRCPSEGDTLQELGWGSGPHVALAVRGMLLDHAPCALG